MDLIRQLESYRPFNEQEQADRALILDQLNGPGDLFCRTNRLAHLTASAWVVTPDRARVLMAYHNIYRSWSWLGGHADGERDLLQVALREVREESGLEAIRPVFPGIYSLEVLTVNGHIKRGAYVSSHLHLNLTYLVEADEREALFIKPDENSGVRWFSPEDAVRASTEPWIRDHIYVKLNQKLISCTP